MEIKKIAENIWEIPPYSKIVKIHNTIKKFQLKVPARVYANDHLIQNIKKDRTLDQITNVACLDGVVKHVIALSDAHQGYGFCIGGVAGTNYSDGAISPGGVGYDINCGVRILSTNLKNEEIRPVLSKLVKSIFNNVPSGLGSKGKLSVSYSDLDKLLDNGVKWAIENEYGWAEDGKFCEENGCLPGADSNKVSRKAKERGIKQIGSLGSGNHFLEIQEVDEIFDEDIAKTLGIEKKGQVTVMVHTGSRAMGHQIATDYLRIFDRAMQRYNIEIPDRELANLKADTNEAQEYLSVMACAANFAWNNRQLITHWVRESFKNVFHKDPSDLGLNLIYDVAHNILKREEHEIEGKKLKLNIHRKGATRAFPPNHPQIPQEYKSIGQPVIIPGTMGSASYLCVGSPESMKLSFGSTAHGAGRQLSRSRAKKLYWGGTIKDQLSQRGILVQAASMQVLAEEAPGAYKNIDQVVQVSHDLKIIKKIARLVPLGVVKG
jgi:tRNA-splicing ligase RtcB